MKLSELIEAEINQVLGGYLGPDDAAAAITTRLHECVKPLEWGRYLIASPMPYQIWEHNGGSGAPDDPFERFNNFRVFDPVSMFSIGPKGDGSDEFETLEDAKAAAQAHYAAQIIAGLNL